MHSIIKELVWIDQLSKLCVITLLKGTFTLIPGLLELAFVQNTGVSFGFLSGIDQTQLIWLKIGVILITLFVYLYYRFQRHYMSNLRLNAIELIIGGAVGNLLDRFLYGGVIDFLSISIFGQHLFTCNFADVYLTFGAILLILSMKEKRPKRPESFKDVLFKEDGL